jgi:hypothetical protein
MKGKVLSLTLVLILGAILSTSIAPPARASIQYHLWVGKTVYYDPIWGYGYTVFPEGSEAKLLVNVFNDWGGYQLNISAVKVVFDWNINYTCAETNVASPVVVDPWSYRTFTVSFTTPDVSTATNVKLPPPSPSPYGHKYTIFVEGVNSTSDPKEAMVHYTSPTYYDFIVYSTAQNEAMDLYAQLYYPMTYYHYFGSDEAQLLYNNATEEYSSGVIAYQTYDFDTAKDHFANALSLYYQALAMETSYENFWESIDQQQAQADLAQSQAQAQYYLAQADYYNGESEYYKGQAEYYKGQGAYYQAKAVNDEMIANASLIEAQALMLLYQAQGNSMMVQSYAWMFFGLGFIVLAIAAVVWAFKRGPKGSPPPAPT